MNRLLKAALTSIITISLALTALYVYQDKETTELNAVVRAELGGQYIQLANGTVHYQLSEKTQNPNTVVLVNGFSSPLQIFDPTYAYLEQHYQVLRFDYFGRGLSDRIESDYAIELYVEQIHNLLVALNIKGKINI